MIIISKFHDYYDHGMSLAYDSEDFRYIRTRQSLDPVLFHTNWNRFGYESYPRDIISSYRLEPFTIVFCGKLYPGVKCTEHDRDYNKTFTYWYTFKGLKEYMLKYSKPYRRVKSYFYVSDKSYFDKVYQEFLRPKETPKAVTDKCISAKIVILVAQMDHFDTTERFVLNRELKDLEFYRIMDPYHAFQELSMWIGGVLIGPERPMITVSNEVKIHKHGFDKWSFRKQPK